MNANASLYKKNLSYRSSAAPYQFLSQSWFVQVPEPVYYPRYRCSIEPLICGEEVFRRISIDIEKAQDSVDIITWGFDPGMVLVRGRTAEEGERYGDLLKRISSREKPVKVRLLVWHDDAAAHLQMKNNPGFYGKMFPSIDGMVVGSYYSEKHQAYNAEWYSQICSGKFPNIIFHVREVPSKYLSSALEDESSPHNPKATVAKMYLSHHQKMLLIDYEQPLQAVGYVMGHNSITDFWDTKEHKFRDERRERFYRVEHSRLKMDAWNRSHNSESYSYVTTEALERDKVRVNQAYVAAPGYEVKVPQGSKNINVVSFNAQSKTIEGWEKRQFLESAYTETHSYVTKPYQDVSCRVRGPVLFDLNHNFCQAWEESKPPSTLFLELFWHIHGFMLPKIGDILEKANQRLTKEETDRHFVKRRKNFPLKAFSISKGTHSLQLLRTQPLHAEKCIKECYANLTRQMLHYIFIQNQYIQYEPWAKHLIECVSRLRNAGYLNQIYVFILTSTPESDGMDLPTYDVASKLGLSEAMRYEHAESLERARRLKQPKMITPKELAVQGIEVFIGSLWVCADVPRKLRPEEYEEIYIHSKVAVVDDAAFTIGSANLNLRSMALDSELNVLSDAHEIAYKLRTDLFSQCASAPGPAAFSNMKETFKEWKRIAELNRALLSAGGALKGQLLPFHVDRKPGDPVV